MGFLGNTRDKYSIFKGIVYIICSILLIYVSLSIFLVGLFGIGYGEVSNRSFYIGIIFLLFGTISSIVIVVGLPYLYYNIRLGRLSKKYLYGNIVLNIFILVSTFILLFI